MPDQITLTLPDGSQRDYPQGTTGYDVAEAISAGLARQALAVKVDGEVRDLYRPIEKSADVQILTWNDAEGRTAFWHSSAHLMAEALEALYPDVHFGIGPAIENGFYYDVDLGDRKLSAADLETSRGEDAGVGEAGRPLRTTSGAERGGHCVF